MRTVMYRIKIIRKKGSTYEARFTYSQEQYSRDENIAMRLIYYDIKMFAEPILKNTKDLAWTLMDKFPDYEAIEIVREKESGLRIYAKRKEEDNIDEFIVRALVEPKAMYICQVNNGHLTCIDTETNIFRTEINAIIYAAYKIVKALYVMGLGHMGKLTINEGGHQITITQ